MTRRIFSDQMSREDGTPIDFLTNNGTYSAVITAGTNCASVTAASTCYWERNADGLVSVYGTAEITPTAGTTATDFTISLPFVLAANFGGTDEAWGTCNLAGAVGGAVNSTNAAKTMTANYTSGGTSAETVNFCFKYIHA